MAPCGEKDCEHGDACTLGSCESCGHTYCEWLNYGDAGLIPNADIPFTAKEICKKSFRPSPWQRVKKKGVTLGWIKVTYL